jgi:hypothetical protein
MKLMTEMKCEDIQFLLDDLARERLAEPVASQVRHHLADCTDCRVVHQRGIRLQRLLALKSHEQPAPQYFDNFLSEFHRRLTASEDHPTFWQRFFSTGDSMLLGSWRFGFAGACGIALTVGLFWMGLRTSNEAVTDASDFSATPFIVYAAPPPASQSAQTFPLEASLASSAPTIETSNGGLTLANAAADRAQPSTPRYVLDRIAITPASYEARADF